MSEPDQCCICTELAVWRETETGFLSCDAHRGAVERHVRFDGDEPRFEPVDAAKDAHRLARAILATGATPEEVSAAADEVGSMMPAWARALDAKLDEALSLLRGLAVGAPVVEVDTDAVRAAIADCNRITDRPYITIERDEQAVAGVPVPRVDLDGRKLGARDVCPAHDEPLTHGECLTCEALASKAAGWKP